ncbi:MAG: Acyl-CoA dehydrogenase [Nocardia sp.]|uniref:acyl-CoA dehydrogenase family protein n=1 Tax=Nocardia sp. TaxID=1821 RepID=UPI00261F37F3|nr:acyl-CoA dehydrogenase family protein [Nocardia sp.]MCU1648821.1 Acyl-CoA dehydrogenase [Nocardia sp.]
MAGDDLTLLRQTVRSAFTELSPAAVVRQQMATLRGWDNQVWSRLCTELGLAGLAVPEEYGGSGGSAVDLGVVFEEAGRALLTAPLFANAALAAPLLLALDDEQANHRYLPGISDGSLVATVVTADAAGVSIPEVVPFSASERGGIPVLTGYASFVVDGVFADLILVPARTAEGLGVFAVEAEAAGLRVPPLVTLDETRKQGQLFLDETPARRVGEGDATAAFRRALDIARVLLANEQVGAAAYCLEATVEYAKTRIQFGRPIGSFQAVKQKVAEQLILVESARSAAMTGAESAAGLPGAPDLTIAAAVAQSYCSEVFVTVTAEMIQLHGGIGFTWEHEAHLYYKRAWTSRELLGAPAQHLETLARTLTDAPVAH